MPTKFDTTIDTEALKPQGFDLRTHLRDKKGRLLKTQPYRLHMRGSQKYFERPLNSGNLFYENGEHAGRLTNGIVDAKAKHIEYTPPLSGSEKMAAELESLRAELDQIKRERAGKTESTKEPTKS